MSKELEALKDIERVCRDSDYLADFYKQRLEIIKTALKDYELMKQTKVIVVDKKISDEDLEKLKNQRMFVSNLEQCEIKPLFDEETQKKLKALEIIKEKKWLVEDILNAFIEDKEKYDLLKEVLL